MRIEIDEATKKILDAIKEKEWQIRFGKGHADTVKFLAKFYNEHKALHEELHKQFENIAEIVKTAVSDAIQTFVNNLFTIRK